MKRIIILILGIVFICFLMGCGKAVNPIIENRVVATLNKHIKAEKWSCKMLGDPNFSKLSVPDVTINGTNIEYDNVIIEKMDLHFKNVRVNLKNRSLKSCEEAYADIRISDESLSKLIKANLTQVTNPEVIANDDKITIKGGVTLLNQNVNLEVTGNIYMKNGIEVYLEPESFSVMKLGIKIPNIAKNLIYKIINPVYKIKNNPYDIYIDSLTYKKGYIECTGKFDPVKISQMLSETQK